MGTGIGIGAMAGVITIGDLVMANISKSYVQNDSFQINNWLHNNRKMEIKVVVLKGYRR